MDLAKFNNILLEMKSRRMRISPSVIADYFEESVQSLTGCDKGEATKVMADLNKIAPSSKHSFKDLASEYLRHRASGLSHTEVMEFLSF